MEALLKAVKLDGVVAGVDEDAVLKVLVGKGVDVVGILFVHGGGGFVEEEERGLGKDGEAYFDALQHAAGKVA